MFCAGYGLPLHFVTVGVLTARIQCVDYKMQNTHRINTGFLMRIFVGGGREFVPYNGGHEERKSRRSFPPVGARLGLLSPRATLLSRSGDAELPSELGPSTPQRHRW